MTSTSTSTQHAGAYVPRLVREWIIDDPSPSSIHRRLEGSMVFADVSGFTMMSERLSRLGRIGAESVTDVISTCFNRMLHEAYAFGATLLQFGGDALLLLLRGPEHQRRAAAAALEMRRALRALRGLPTEAGAVSLNMTVGVQSGHFDFFLVGGSHRQLVVGGPTASRLVELEGAAAKGRLLVSDSTAALLPARNVGPRSGPGRLLRGHLDLPRQAGAEFLDVDADMSRYIPVGLTRVIESGSVHPEHRMATVGFVEYRGLDDTILASGTEEAARRLDELVRGVQAAIDGRGVCFQSADVGENGGKLYLSVGAPISTGNDEEQMLHALREIVELDVGLAVRAGTNSGGVFTGEIGTIHRRTLATMGDAVNLAARLTAKADWGQVLSTGSVLDRSRTLFATVALEPFLVKGKRLPVQAYDVGPVRGDRTDIAGAELPLVGRDEELAIFSEATAAARRGRGTSVELVAEPGAGKSRLIDRVEADAADLAVRRVQCRLYQASTPYFPFAELLRGLLGLTDDATDEEVITALREAVHRVDPDLDPWLSLVGVPLGLEIEPSDAVRKLDDEFRRGRIESSVTALLAGLLPRPSLLCFEDVHWMDDASAALLDALAGSLTDRPWVIVVTRRGSGADRASDARPPDVRIELEPLGSEALTELVATATEGSPLPGHVVSTLVARCDGNPLFLLELVNAVRSGGSLDSLPTSIEGLIMARIDRLSPDDRTLLRHVAVLGARVRVRYVATVLPDSEPDAGTIALRRLREFLDVDADGWVSFRHQLVRDVAYGGLPYRTRRELHSRIAESVLERVGDHPEHEAPLLSLHYFEARRLADAWRFSLIAGDQARAVYANVEAATFYRRALTAARHLDEVPTSERATTFEALGDVQDLAGLYEDARRSYAAGRGLLPDDPVRRAQLALKRAFIDERLGHYVRAVRAIREGLRLLDGVRGEDAVRCRGQLTVWFAAIRLAQGKFRDAAESSRKGIALAEEVGDTPTVAQAYLTLDYALSSLGEADGPRASRAALAIYTELEDLRGQAVAANVLGSYAFLDGRWDEAADLFRRARDAKEQTGDPAGAALANVSLAEILLEQGRVDEADAVLRDVIAVWRASGDRWAVAYASRLLGLAEARRGSLEDARRLLEEARDSFTEIGAAQNRVESEVAIAELLLFEGQPNQARELLDEVLAADPTGAGVDYLLPSVHRLRGIASSPADPQGAHRDVERALLLARARGARHEVALSLWTDEMLADLGGHPVGAERRSERVELFDSLGIVARSRPLPPQEVISET